MPELATAVLLSLVAAQPGPPPTAAEPVRDVYHGVEIVDPYRWLEGDEAPEVDGDDPELAARVAAWTDAQNAYTRSVLEKLPGRRAVFQRLQRLLASGRGFRGEVSTRGRRTFWLELAAGRSQPVLKVAEEGGEPRTLVDPGEIDAEGLTTIAWYEPDPRGDLVAFGLFRAGDENATLYLVDAASGVWRADEIPNKVREVRWTPDASGFFYNCVADLDDPYSRAVRFHRVGTHRRHDRELARQDPFGPGGESWGPFADLTDDGRWLILGLWQGSGANDLWAADARSWLAGGELERRPIVVGEDARSGLADVYEDLDPVRSGTLYMSTTVGAPNGRVVAVDLERPGREHWRELIPERPDAVVQRVSAGRDRLAVEYLKGAATAIELFDLAGKARGALDLPGIGTASLTADPSTNLGWLEYTSFQHPGSLYRVDLETGERSDWWHAEVDVDPSRFQVDRVWYSSKDGTRVSMFLVHRKGLALDGGNPTILHGYGGFGISMTPGFDVGHLPWIEWGGVVAIPNLRGGGEYGEAWHRAGMLERKQNVFDDFIAAAEWLIEKGYTCPERLAVEGGSNGGLLVTAALTQRPDLFSAVVATVPIVDVLRYHLFRRAGNWVSELGSSDNPRQFRFLRAYSPYHNVKDGVKYPAVLLTAAERDERVSPLHARKMAARLQAATASDPAAEPVLLWVEREAGHGAGASVDQQMLRAVDQMSFLIWQLGLTVEE